MDVRQKPAALFIGAEPSVGETEHLHGMLFDCGKLHRPAADRIVFGKHDPLLLACEGDPLLIAHRLCPVLAVDRRQCVSDVTSLL